MYGMQARTCKNDRRSNEFTRRAFSLTRERIRKLRYVLLDRYCFISKGKSCLIRPDIRELVSRSFSRARHGQAARARLYLRTIIYQSKSKARDITRYSAKFHEASKESLAQRRESHLSLAATRSASFHRDQARCTCTQRGILFDEWRKTYHTHIDTQIQTQTHTQIYIHAHRHAHTGREGQFFEICTFSVKYAKAKIG